MSKYNYINVKCEKCGKENKVKVWNSLNVTIDRKYKKTILDDTFFKFQCSKCGHKGKLQYQCLYNDMEKNMMIYMIPGYDENSIKDLNEVLKNNISNEMMKENYILRVVSNAGELREKILINENNYDDIIMELLKIYYRALFYQQSPEKEIEMAYFEVREGNAELAFYPNNAKAFSIPFDELAYQKIETIYEKEVNRVKLEGFQIINSDWVENAILNNKY